MLKSTYAAPPPLPPGWSEHKAPSGWLRLMLVMIEFLPLTIYQGICITTTLKRSNLPILDHNRFLSHLNRLKQVQTSHRFSRQIPYHRSLLRRTRRMDSDSGLVSRGVIITKVQRGGDFVAEKGTKTVNHGGQRTGQNPNMLSLGVHHGYS